MSNHFIEDLKLWLICIQSRIKQLPVTFGDDFNSIVDYFDGCLIVNSIHRHRKHSSPFFCVSQGGILVINIIQMGNQRKFNQSGSMSGYENPVYFSLWCIEYCIM